MPKLSAGLLLYRVTQTNIVEVLIVHPGGPFWAKKDDGAWSIPKGEYTEELDAYETALREFHEELGSSPPGVASIDLGEIRQSSGKRLHVWAMEGDLDASRITSNTFEMEWPPKSDKTATFPEVDRAAWVPIAVARRMLLKGHVDFLPLLLDFLRGTGRDQISEGVEAPPQSSLF
jgi:predicted NUDIX family NTP pyrophosphohydrolase